LVILTCSYVILRYEHKRIRESGFLRFYIKANKYIRTIYFIVTLSLSILCTVFLFYPDSDALNRAVLMDVLLTLEMLICLVLSLLYIQLCWQFNKARPLPDAHQWQQSSGIVQGTALGGLSLIDSTTLQGTRGARDVVQKQALMLRHLDKQLRTVSEELQRTKASSKFSNMTNRRSDFDNLLNIKDQEIRALKVERDRLRQEQKQTATDLESLASSHNLTQKEHEQCVKELDKAKNQIRTLEKDKAQLQILVEVHKETNKDMQKMLDTLRGDES